MIKNIFLPEKIGNYYIFSKRIIGFDISKTHVNATQIYVNGNKRIIEKYIEEKIESDSTAHYSERVRNALKKALEQTSPHGEIHSCLNSSLVIFKELSLPFLQYEKIKMVINFEIEPLLPFAIDKAAIDFIITKQHLKEQRSEVLVAAVQKERLEEHINLFTELNIKPTVITVDLIALYGLYTLIPSYAHQEGDIALVDLGIHSTRIAYIHDGQLRFIRTLPKGTFNQAKEAGEELHIQPAAAMEHLVRFGLEENDDKKTVDAIKKSTTLFWQEINFTIQSFSKKTEHPTIEKMILLGSGSELKGLTTFIHNTLDIPCELFNLTPLFNEKNITIKNKHTIPSSSIISLSTALPAPLTDTFNLGDTLGKTDIPLLKKQVVIAFVLVIALFSTIIAHSFFQIRKLQDETTSSTKEIITTLKKQFPKIEGTRLDDILEEAQQAVDEEEKLWFAFSGPARASSLEYLLELTNRIDKKSLGFVVEKITITEGTITLKARVKDYEALKILERDLRQSKRFSYVEPQEKTDFTMRIGLLQNAEGI